jgi:cation diffusion facilitator family transporter
VTVDLRRLTSALAVCGTATAGELAGGVMTRSLALTADGLHSLVHVSALLVAIWGARLPKGREPDAGGEAAAINALMIVVLAVLLMAESVGRLGAPADVAYGPALALTGFGLVANLLTVAALGGGSPEDLNHRAALLHMLGDAGVAVLALVGLGCGWLFGWAWADATTGLIGAVLLAFIGGRLMHRALASPSVRTTKPRVALQDAL